jgi:lysophospholipase L1-like esterase
MVMKIALFGDSITQGFPGASYVSALANKLPEHNLFNYGKGGDTVISLYRRLKTTSLESPFDISVLWVGVNDVYVKTSWRFPILKKLRGQPWIKDHHEFKAYYKKLLEFITGKSSRIITISPLFIGEDLSNIWNRELNDLGKIIEEVTGEFKHSAFIDLQTVFFPHLERKIVSPYVPKSVTKLILTLFFRRSYREIKEQAEKRKLHYTIDGVHLNAAGAEIVADEIAKKISGDSSD